MLKKKAWSFHDYSEIDYFMEKQMKISLKNNRPK